MKKLLISLFVFSAAMNSATATPGNKSPDLDLPSPHKKLTPEDEAALKKGEISTPKYLIGGGLAIFPGFGVGHIVQGRYADKGWVFTVTEGASILMMSAGVGDDPDCDEGDGGWGDDDDWDFTARTSHRYKAYANGGPDGECDLKSPGLVLAGLATFIGFKTWEIIDAWVTPRSQNRRYRQAKENAQAIYMLPTNEGLQIGMQLSF